jgi:hypothetical protein
MINGARSDQVGVWRAAMQAPHPLLLDTLESQDLARLMIGLNALGTLHRAMQLTFTSGYMRRFGAHVAMGDGVVLLAKTVATFKEAADQFHSTARILKELAGKHDSRLKAEVESLERDLDKSDPTSFYTKQLKPIRDQIGFHWKRSAVVEALEQRRDEPLPIVVHSITATRNEEVRFAAMDLIVASVMFGTDNPEEVAAMVARVGTHAERFLGVCHSAISLYLAQHGCLYSGFESTAEFGPA